MKQLNCAVIGVGYLGRFHAQKYQKISGVSLIGVCDVNAAAAQTVGDELNVPAYTNHRLLFDLVDAVSIAVSTREHYAIAREFMAHGIHVLIEKPMTETLEQARDLVELSARMHVKCQIGHLERFNAARLAIGPYLHKPLFIDAQRLAPFTPRGADVNVILDLMIHDIDLIQTMVNSPLRNIEAHGAVVLSRDIDIANARLTFENNCVANVSASRVSFKKERKTRIFQANSYIVMDDQAQSFSVFTKGSGEMFPGIPNVEQTQSTFESRDALLEEITSFVECVRNNTTPLVTAADGYAALVTADKITALIHQHLNVLEHDVHQMITD